jgi:hypothetical protein
MAGSASSDVGLGILSAGGASVPRRKLEARGGATSAEALRADPDGASRRRGGYRFDGATGFASAHPRGRRPVSGRIGAGQASLYFDSQSEPCLAGVCAGAGVLDRVEVSLTLLPGTKSCRLGVPVDLAADGLVLPCFAAAPRSFSVDCAVAAPAIARAAQATSARIDVFPRMANSWKVGNFTVLLRH